MIDTARPASLNMTLLAHHTLNGSGGMGEGVAIQCLPGGRRVLWLAHESAPKNFTGVDVTEPRTPRIIVQTNLPHASMRSNSLEVSGNLMAVAYQVSRPGLAPAGFELFDVSIPERPRSIASFDASAPHSRGCHALWFVDGTTVHMTCSDPAQRPRNPKDDQIYRIVSVANPSNPVAVGSWHLPGTMKGDNEAPPLRLPPPFDSGFPAHNTNVYPERPDRCYLGYLDGGAIILDIGDPGQPVLVSQWRDSPPLNGFTHTVLPLFERNLLVVSDESIMNQGADWPKLVWLLDARDEHHPLGIATLPAPPDAYMRRGGRFGAHNLHENPPVPGAWKSQNIVVGTFFNAGVRAYDIRNAFAPREIAYYVPAAPNGSPVGTVQLNDVLVDDRGVLYTVDRHIGGLYVLEVDL